MASSYVWRSGAGNLAVAANWLELTDAGVTVVRAPGVLDRATIDAGGGIVSGILAVADLSLAGTTILAGTLTALATDLTGSLIVSGGTLAASGLVSLNDGTLAVGPTSVVEVCSPWTGRLGSTAAGTLTVDDMAQLLATGTVDAPVVNGGDIWIGGGGLLDVTGALTGPGTVHVSAGSVLLLESSAAGSTISFEGDQSTLRLAHAETFHGALAFSAMGGTIDLVGQVATGASVNGGTLSVALADGGTIALAAAGVADQTLRLVADGAGGTAILGPIMPRYLRWNATSGDLAVAANWIDLGTSAPADAAPRPDDIVAIGAGTVTGTLAVSQVLFDGTSTLAGTVTAQTTFLSGSLRVAGGGLTTAGMGVSGGTLSISPTAVVEVGGAGGAAAGRLTVDAGISVSGTGTIDAPVVNNGWIAPDRGGTLEVVGALTGTGGLQLNGGELLPSNVPALPVLQLDSSVAPTQQVSFVGGPMWPLLRLARPGTFHGDISDIESGGVVDVIGATVVSARVHDGTLAVGLAGGGMVSLSVTGLVDQTPYFLSDGAGGTEIVLTSIPRSLRWSAATGDLAVAGNWIDTATHAPAVAAPSQMDTVTIGNGTVTGTLHVTKVVFDGTSTLAGALTAGTTELTGSLRVSGGTLTTTAMTIAGGALSISPASVVEVGIGGAVSGGLTVNAGSYISATGTIDAAVVNNGEIAADLGGTLEITGPVTGRGTLRVRGGQTVLPYTTGEGFQEDPWVVRDASVLQLDGPVGSKQQIWMEQDDSPPSLTFFSIGTIINTPPTLRLVRPDTFLGRIGQADAGIIDLVGITATAANVTNGTLSVRLAGGGTIALAVANVADQTLQVTSDGSGGSEISSGMTAGSDWIASDYACFVGGSRIRTVRGDRPVESLRPGDRVVTASGRAAPVVWIGHRTLDPRRHRRTQDVMPVRVSAHAFGAGRPGRDLLVSPDHAVFADGVLIPVRYLLNGATLVQKEHGTLTYYHVELDRHDVLIAEGLPTESYLDTGNRGAFANGGGALQAHPDFARGVWARSGCAELVCDGPHLVAVRSALLEQARQLGHVLTQETDLHLLAGGRRIDPAWRDAETGFVLPDGAGTVHLVSRTTQPALTIPESSDHRVLGVAVASLVLDGRPVSLDDHRIGTGWAVPEPGWRWTTGMAALDCTGGSVLEVRTLDLLRYWRPAPLPAGKEAYLSWRGVAPIAPG